ncbi:MAG: DUF1997 domain-containing protein [Anaerolineales bacterium]|nr:DUF1997 domain-containing protein [Anaerolineales bacterium]MCA9974464.1 DUF1997 domain-containing protein [Anaerolineales bacterium]
MIKIASSAKLSFMFPADVDTAVAYYQDFARVVEFLQHIDLAPSESVTPDEYRLCYHTVELGRYHIHVYCDVRVEVDHDEHVIRLLPIQNFPPIKTEVTLNSTTTRGNYSSVGYFYAAGEGATRIEYELRMEASPPKPKGMRFVPGRIVDSVAQNITTTRIREIAQGFIENSLQAFPAWRDAYLVDGRSS